MTYIYIEYRNCAGSAKFENTKHNSGQQNKTLFSGDLDLRAVFISESLISEMASVFPYQVIFFFAMTNCEISWKTIVEHIYMFIEQGLDEVYFLL